MLSRSTKGKIPRVTLMCDPARNKMNMLKILIVQCTRTFPDKIRLDYLFPSILEEKKTKINLLNEHNVLMTIF